MMYGPTPHCTPFLPGHRCLPSVVTFLIVTIAAYASEVNAEDKQKGVKNFLGQFCVECHRDGQTKGGLSLEALSLNDVERDVGLWEEVLHRIESGNMPPESAENRPQDGQRNDISRSIREMVEEARRKQDEKRAFVLRRLNRREYSNSIRDLLQIKWDASQDMPMDDGMFGFDNVAEGLQLSTVLAESYFDSARAALDRAIRTDAQPEVRRWHYHLGSPADFPTGSTHFSVYNGNAHMAFGDKSVYIGGPALYTEVFPYPPNRFMYEGTYRLVVRLTPHNFADGAVAALRVDGPKRMIEQRDIKVQNDKEVVVETTFYYDRSDECLKTELNWTNGHHLSWQVRNNPKNDPYYNYWWLINYKEVDGKRIDFKPQTASELPFGYFDRVSMEVSGPYNEAWPPKSMTQWFGNSVEESDPSVAIKAFLAKCFRRDIGEHELHRYVAHFDRIRSNGTPIIDAYKGVFTIALTSPDFLFLLPGGGQSDAASHCDSVELASRLSYFLWSSPPDETLRELARTGRLNESSVIAQQATRMLQDPKSKEFKTNFTRQWLRLDKLSSVMPEPKLFPFFSESLRDAMRDETLWFLCEMIDHDLPIRQLISSDWTYVNEKLADHYGVSGVDGDSMRRVTAIPDSRGGLFTHASMLTLNSESTRTSPVLRGKWILDCLFHRPPPPPPPNVSSLQPDASAARTPKEHLMSHKEIAACAGCHARIDPFGLVLENYDAVGHWRMSELPWEDPASNEKRSTESIPKVPVPIDATTQLADGTVMNGPSDLKKYLIEHEVEIATGVTEQLMIYALGRGLRQLDIDEAKRIVQSNAGNGYRMQSLILGIILSDSFRANTRSHSSIESP